MQKINSLQDFTARLEKVKPLGGGQFRARCPAHEDDNPSLSVTEKNDKILVYCHAGCSTREILDAMGLDDKDLFLKQNGNAPTRTDILENYDYKDEGGELLYQVCRTEDKAFPQRRPVANGWEWGLGKTKRVLYKLPKVKEAIEKGRYIFLVEGEKDVDNLEKLGFAATCNPMGAGKWNNSYTDALEGANVVILPDNDEEGRNHARRIGEELQGNTSALKVIQLPDLPEKGDVSDWIKNGGTAKELKAIVKEEKEFSDKLALTSEKEDKNKGDNWTPDIKLLSTVEAEEITWLWKPYLPKKKITLLEGDPGVGKTFLALQLAARVSQGENFLKPGVKERDPEMVLYMTAEDGLSDTIRPRLDQLDADPNHVATLKNEVNKETGEKNFITLKDTTVLTRTFAKVNPALVVIDPLQGFLGSKVDMHRANEVRPILSDLADLAEEFNASILLIRHLTKSSRSKSIYRGIGSIDFTAHARSILMAGEDPDNEDQKVMAHVKSNLVEAGPAIGYRLDDEGFRWTGESKLTGRDIVEPEKSRGERSKQEEAEEYLKATLRDGPKPSSEMYKDATQELGVSKETVRNAKRAIGVASERRSDHWIWYLPNVEGEEGNDP